MLLDSIYILEIAFCKVGVAHSNVYKPRQIMPTCVAAVEKIVGAVVGRGLLQTTSEHKTGPQPNQHTRPQSAVSAQE